MNGKVLRLSRCRMYRELRKELHIYLYISIYLYMIWFEWSMGFHIHDQFWFFLFFSSLIHNETSTNLPITECNVWQQKNLHFGNNKCFQFPTTKSRSIEYCRIVSKCTLLCPLICTIEMLNEHWMAWRSFLAHISHANLSAHCGAMEWSAIPVFTTMVRNIPS